MQTVVILDFDDTLFPTTWLKDDLKLSSRSSVETLRERGEISDPAVTVLKILCDRMVLFLKKACRSSEVVIVTLSQRPWVHESCKNFCPDLLRTIEDLNIPVIYAREGVDEQMLTAKGRRANDLCSVAKGHAIKKALTEVYARSGRAACENVISIGDSDFERYGTHYAFASVVANECHTSLAASANGKGGTLERIDDEGVLTKRRLKTLKLLERPTADELIAESCMLINWIDQAIAKDDGFDFTLEDDDETLTTIHEKITGQQPPDKLRWSNVIHLGLELNDGEVKPVSL